MILPRELMKKIIGNDQATPDEITQINNLLIKLGGINHAQQLAADYVKNAQLALADLPDPPAKQYFKEWIELIVNRSF